MEVTHRSLMHKAEMQEMAAKQSFEISEMDARLKI